MWTENNLTWYFFKREYYIKYFDHTLQIFVLPSFFTPKIRKKKHEKSEEKDPKHDFRFLFLASFDMDALGGRSSPHPLMSSSTSLFPSLSRALSSSPSPSPSPTPSNVCGVNLTTTCDVNGWWKEAEIFRIFLGIISFELHSCHVIFFILSCSFLYGGVIVYMQDRSRFVFTQKFHTGRWSASILVRLSLSLSFSSFFENSFKFAFFSHFPLLVSVVTLCDGVVSTNSLEPSLENHKDHQSILN